MSSALGPSESIGQQNRSKRLPRNSATPPPLPPVHWRMAPGKGPWISTATASEKTRAKEPPYAERTESPSRKLAGRGGFPGV
eukprot:scaffold2319_cov248-Pinguiococcus_pyrenoidosus.AAC.6